MATQEETETHSDHPPFKPLHQEWFDIAGLQTRQLTRGYKVKQQRCDCCCARDHRAIGLLRCAAGTVCDRCREDVVCCCKRPCCQKTLIRSWSQSILGVVADEEVDGERAVERQPGDISWVNGEGVSSTYRVTFESIYQSRPGVFFASAISASGSSGSCKMPTCSALACGLSR